MSVCTFIAADCPLPTYAPEKDYPIHINIDNDNVTVFDGDADDNYCLNEFVDVSVYTDKEYGVSLEWAYHTPGRAERIIEYIRKALENSDTVELWHVWLTGYWEFDERPVYVRDTVTIDELTAQDIKDLDDAEIWNNKDKQRPSFYCLTVCR